LATVKQEEHEAHHGGQGGDERGRGPADDTFICALALYTQRAECAECPPACATCPIWCADVAERKSMVLS
jgi:hypothetical protein